MCPSITNHFSVPSKQTIWKFGRYILIWLFDLVLRHRPHAMSVSVILILCTIVLNVNTYDSLFTNE